MFFFIFEAHVKLPLIMGILEAVFIVFSILLRRKRPRVIGKVGLLTDRWRVNE